jgi:hypothetical protein
MLFENLNPTGSTQTQSNTKLLEDNLFNFISNFDLTFYDFNQIKDKNLVELNSKYFSNKHRIVNTYTRVLNDFTKLITEPLFIQYCSNKNLFIFNFEKKKYLLISLI